MQLEQLWLKNAPWSRRLRALQSLTT